MTPHHTTTYQSESVSQTEEIAASLARTLSGGRCVALHGDLGAGKTQFVRGLVRGLGGPHRAVSSPTFILLNIYRGGRLAVYHLDAYRVTSDDLEAIGFAELLEQGGIVVVEWAERIGQLLPAEHLSVSIQPTSDTSREIRIEPKWQPAH